MGRKTSLLEAVLADSTNIAASTVQADVGEQDQGKRMPVTFSRKGKVAQQPARSTNENEECTPHAPSRRASVAESASPSLTDCLTPLVSEHESSPPESFLSARTELQLTASNSKTSRLGIPALDEGLEEQAEMQGGRGRKANYPRRVAPSKDEQQGAAHAAYMARMAAHFAEVDDFDLTVDSPDAAGTASPDLAPQRLSRAAELATEDRMLCQNAEGSIETMNASKGSSGAASACTAQWLQAIPAPAARSGEAAPPELHLSGVACSEQAQARDTAAGSAPESALVDGASNASHVDGEATSEPEDTATRLSTGDGKNDASDAGSAQRQLSLTAPEAEDNAEGEEDEEEGVEAITIPLVQPRRSSIAGRLSHKGRMSLAHARKSLAGAQVQPMARRSRLSTLPIRPDHDRDSNIGPQQNTRRSSVYEALSSRFSLSQGLSKVSLGLSSALRRLSLGPAVNERDPVLQAEGRVRHAEGLPDKALLDTRKRAISPIAESPESDTSASPEAVHLVADSSSLQLAQTGAEASQEDVVDGLTEQLDAKLQISEEAEAVPEQAAVPAEALTPLQHLLKLCDQEMNGTALPSIEHIMGQYKESRVASLSSPNETDVEALPSMEQMLGQHVKLKTVKKIGEGTFAEAFKGSSVVFKIMPMEGKLLVNGEPQKKAEEITAEVAIALTLSQLHPESGNTAQNSTQGFVQTYGVGVCRGRYASTLVKEWHAWDKRNGSENDPVDMFGNDQLFVIFVVANGGADLEHFEVHSYEEARSIILQTVLALAVAEEAVQFEHRDLHWGNLLIKRVPAGQRIVCTLRGVSIAAESAGVQITLIDFTLSRLCTIDGSGAYCDLDADPELFQGPKGDCQADTYRRMRKATKGKWEGFHPATNALWMHYLADTLLNLKAFSMEPSQKKQLRDFRKRALSVKSCSDLLMDDFLRSDWLAGGA